MKCSPIAAMAGDIENMQSKQRGQTPLQSIKESDPLISSNARFLAVAVFLRTFDDGRVAGFIEAGTGIAMITA